MNKKSVLFVVDERMMGGVSVLLKDMLYMMDLSKLDVDLLILHDRGDMLTDLPENVNVIYGTKYFSTIDLTFRDVLKSKSIIKILRKLRTVFDLKTGLVKKRIICERKKMRLKHYNYEVAFKDGFTAVFSAYSDSDVKYHWIQYDYGVSNPNEKYQRLMIDVLSRFNKIIAVSDGIKNDFNKIYNMDNKVTVIENLVNVDNIQLKCEEKSDVKLDSHKINLVCMGRLVNSHKGFDRLIDAVNKLNLEGCFDNCVLRIYGDGPDRESLNNQIKNYELDDKVILGGRVRNPFKYYKGNDLFILPSRYEAFGLVIVEALICGVPVLVTNNGATSKIVDSKYGVIVNNTDDGIYDGLKDLLSNPAKLKKLQKNVKSYCYDNNLILEKLNKLFK